MRLTYLLTPLCLLVLSISIFSQKLVADPSFTPVTNGGVYFLEILVDGKMMIAGDFTQVNGVSRVKIARLNANGTLDTTFDANATTIVNGGASTASISSMEILPDGKIVLAGSFGSGQPLEYTKVVVRLNADGSFDSTMTSVPQMIVGGTSSVYKAESLPGGKILICGDFLLANNNPQAKLARYNSNGTFDATFTTALNNNCRDVESRADGRYLVAGDFTTVNGDSRTGLVRFNANDSVDAGFNAQPVLYRTIELQNDGTVLGFLQSGFDQILQRLNADGSLKTAYANELFSATDVASLPDGKVLVVGSYRPTFGQSLYLNRYNTDGTHDPSTGRLHLYNLTPNPVVSRTVAVAADGSIVLGGLFTDYSLVDGGEPISRPNLIRFTQAAIPKSPKYDLDGDGRDDIAVFRPSDRFWYVHQSNGGFSYTQFGLPADKPTVADYDGDGRADIAVVRDGVWMWLRSSDNTFAFRVCGQAGDLPTPRYGTNKTASLLVFRPSAAQFYSQNIYQDAQPVEFRNMTLQSTDKPVIADYDGDGADDLAVFRNGDWYYMASNNLETRHFQFGLAGDIPAIGDFDGDGRSDFAVFRPSSGVWFIQRTTDGPYAVQWGLNGDLPVAADYDGDGRTDIAVFRPSTGVWYLLQSSFGVYAENFGLSGDVPAQLR